MKKSISLLSITSWLVAVCFFASEAAVLKGTVKDMDSGGGLVGANVLLVGEKYGASTDLNGEYVIFNLPAGVYTVQVTILGYAPEEARGIRLDEKEEKVLSFLLRPTAIDLEEVTVDFGGPVGSQQAVQTERLSSAIITDAVSSEAMSKMPDPDVSQVVRRTTGVSTMNGDPVIRGLGVRYSKVSLNNSHLAGTEPNQSAVSLELFPASLMDQITVSKTYLPDQFGEFGGGIVDMSTWEFPGDPVLNASLSLGYRDNTTLGNFMSYPGGRLDVLGIDDGTRSLPDAIENADTRIVERGMFSSIGLTTEEVEGIGESFENIWNPQKTTALPNMSFSWSVANSTQLWNRKLGYMVSSIYRNSNSYLESEKNIYKGGAGGNIELWHNYDFQIYTSSITLGGMAALNYNLSPYSKINLNTMYNRETDDETRFFSGYNDDRQKNIQDTRLRFVAQTTFTTQVSGDHVVPELGNSVINWQATFSRGTRNEPDTREYQYEADPGEEFVLADETQSGSRIFNDLYDNTLSTDLDWTYRFGSKSNALKLKSGVSFLVRHRDSETRFFQFEPTTNNSVDVTQDPEYIFSPENIGPEGFMIAEYTRPTDSYEADQDLRAVYIMAEKPLSEKIRTVGGLRLEHSVQKVTSYELFTASMTPIVGEIVTTDLLPAASIIYSPWYNTNFRLAASQTVSRPDFRELSEFEFTDVIGGHAVIGNPNLERALIRHVDFRWEWAHGRANLLAVSLFYKYFKNPIEVVIQPTAQHRISYENAQGADNYGIELEVQQAFGNLLGLPKSSLSVSTNLTLLKSNIQLSDSTKGIQTSSRRPLHGQSPYLFNLNLSYSSPRWLTQVDLFYHIFGKRISEVGSKPLPDIYEMPHPDMDLTFRQPLNRNLSLKGGVENILDPVIRFKQGDCNTEVYRLGRVYSLGVSYSP